MAAQWNELVEARLKELGYKYDPAADNLDFAMGKIEHHIYNYCNISELPEAIKYVYIDMVCSEYLNAKKNSGQDLSGINFEPLVESIKRGDTNVSFKVSGSESSTFDALLQYLYRGHKAELNCFRRFKW